MIQATIIQVPQKAQSVYIPDLTLFHNFFSTFSTVKYIYPKCKQKETNEQYHKMAGPKRSTKWLPMRNRKRGNFFTYNSNSKNLRAQQSIRDKPIEKFYIERRKKENYKHIGGLYVRTHVRYVRTLPANYVATPTFGTRHRCPTNERKSSHLVANTNTLTKFLTPQK